MNRPEYAIRGIGGAALAWKKLLHIVLFGVVLALPLISTMALLQSRHQRTMDALVPVWADEVYYWHQAKSFAVAGFNTGYYTVLEKPASAAFTRYFTWGPVLPFLYGVVARLTWDLNSIPILNLLLFMLGLAAFIRITRPDILALVLLIAAMLTFLPFHLRATSSLPEVLFMGIALTVAAILVVALRQRRATSQRFVVGAVTWLLLVAQLRITWAVFLLPVLLLTWRNRSWKGILAALLLALGLMSASFAVQQWLGAPYPYVFNQGTDDLLTRILARARENLALFNQGDPQEVQQRYQVLVLCGVFMLMGIWGIVRRHTLLTLEMAIHLFNLASVLAITILLYDVREWRDHRYLALHLLIALGVCVAMRRWVIIAAITVWMATLAVPFFTVYDIWTGYHLAPEYRANATQLAQEYAQVISYDPETANPWCNTVYYTLYYLLGPAYPLTALPAGIGLSSALEFSGQAYPLKSRYVILRDDQLPDYAEQVRLEPLLPVPDGKLYHNLDAACS